MELDVQRQLLEACDAGHEHELALLLDRPDVHLDQFVGEDGNPLLNYAAANGHEKVAECLLQRSADVNQASMYGWSPLMQASAYGHTAVLGLLLAHGADVNRVNVLGSSALFCAARGGHTTVVHSLLQASAELDNESGALTPLMAASMAGHESVCRLLIDKGANVNACAAGTGWTALMHAAHNGYLSVAQLLVSKRCSTQATNCIGMNALDIASAGNQKAVEAFLMQKTGTMSSMLARTLSKMDIFEATKNGKYDEVRDLLDADSKLVNKRDEHSATCLMLAAMRGHLAIVELLVDRGADMDVQDDIAGWTALMNATFYQHKSISKFLVTSGANVTIRAHNGNSCLDIASLIGDTETVWLLASVSMGAENPEALAKKGGRLFSPAAGARVSRSRDVHRPDDKDFMNRSFASLMQSQARIFTDDNNSSDDSQQDILLARKKQKRRKRGKSRSKKVPKPTGNAKAWRRAKSTNRILPADNAASAASDSGVGDSTEISRLPPHMVKKSIWSDCFEFRKRRKATKMRLIIPVSKAVAPRQAHSRMQRKQQMLTQEPRGPTVTHFGAKQPDKRFTNIQERPVLKLPAEILAPIKPPFMPPPAFEMVNIERPKFERPSQRQSSDFSSPAILKGPSLSRARSNFLRPQDRGSLSGLPRKPVPKQASDEQGKSSKGGARVTFAASPVSKIVPASPPPEETSDSDTGRTPSPLPERVTPDLADILLSKNLGDVASVFQREEIDKDTFLTLSDTDLVELGISQAKKRDSLIALIKVIRQEVETAADRLVVSVSDEPTIVGANAITFNPESSGTRLKSSTAHRPFISPTLPPTVVVPPPPRNLPNIRVHTATKENRKE